MTVASNNVISIQDRHVKQLAVMRGWLDGKRFYAAAEALELVRQLESGTRKDGKTPKFHHQLSVVRFLTTLLPHFEFPEDTLTAAFLHDLLEDHVEWDQEKVAEKFGPRVAKAVYLLTKKQAGFVKSYDKYFKEMAVCPIASIVKPVDRAHNIQTMQGVFTVEKQKAYLAELDTYFFPLLREARRLHNSQYPAYENVKILLRCQASLIRSMHASMTPQERS